MTKKQRTIKAFKALIKKYENPFASEYQAHLAYEKKLKEGGLICST